MKGSPSGYSLPVRHKCNAPLELDDVMASVLELDDVIATVLELDDVLG